MNPRYPIYIVSKGRWEQRLTANTLNLMKVPFKMVVEEHEYDNYTKEELMMMKANSLLWNMTEDEYIRKRYSEINEHIRNKVL